MAKKIGKITKTEEGEGKEFKGPGIEGKKISLAGLKTEHERLTAEEDTAGFMDGHIVSRRKARIAAIENLEAEVGDEE